MAERFDLLWRYPQERYVAAGRRDVGQPRHPPRGVRGDGRLRLALPPRRGHRPLPARGRRGPRARVVSRRPRWRIPAATGLPAVARRGFEHGASARRLARAYPGRAGRRYWTCPGGLVRRGAALRALSVEPVDDRGVEFAARVDYGARIAGSLWAEVARRAVR